MRRVIAGSLLVFGILIAQQISVRNIQPGNKRGNGPYIQLGSGSVTTNHIAKYDASGNLIDGGLLTSGPSGPAGSIGSTGPSGPSGPAGSSGSLSGIPTNGLIFSNGSVLSGTPNVTWDSSLNRIVVTGSTTSKSFLGENYVYSLLNGIAGKTIFALADAGSGNGILRISNGTGTGGLDGNGAQILATASNGSLGLTGKIDKYNGIVTQAQGVPVIAYYASLAGATTTQTITLAVNSAQAPAGLYRASAFLGCTALGTAGKVNASISYHDAISAGDTTEFPTATGTDNFAWCLTGSENSKAYPALTFYHDGTTNIVFNAVLVEAFTGTASYKANVTLERLF